MTKRCSCVSETCCGLCARCAAANNRASDARDGREGDEGAMHSNNNTLKRRESNNHHNGQEKKGREGRKANEENVPRTHTHSKRARQAKKGGLGKKLTDPSPLRSSATTEKPTRSATPQEPMHVEKEKEGGENKRGWETVCHHPASATHRESTAMGKTHLKCLRLLRCTATLRVSVCVCVCVF